MEGVTQEAASLAGHLAAGQADLSLRSEPHLARRRHRPVLHRRCGEALRGLWLAHASQSRMATIRRTSPRRSRKRKREDRPAVADSGAARTSATAVPKKQDNFCVARQSAGRRRTAGHQEGARLAHHGQVLPAGGSASTISAQAHRQRRASRRPNGRQQFDAYQERFPDEAAEFEIDLTRQASRRLGCRSAEMEAGR